MAPADADRGSYQASPEFDKKINEWVETINKHKGEETAPWPASYPVDVRNVWGQQAIELVTEDIIRHFAAGMGDRNPLYWSRDYTRKTRWGGIIAPPTFTDAIAISWITKREPEPVPWFFSTEPAGNKRELFGVFRPGDEIRLIEKYLGLEERILREPRPYRLFVDSNQRLYINQKDQVVARVTFRYVRLITSSDPTQQWRNLFKGRMTEKKRHKFTDEEIDTIIRGYEANKRRGADTLYWEDVAVGDAVPVLTVGPMVANDSVAFHSAQQGHCVAFDISWEREKAENIGPIHRDPETNALWGTYYSHTGDHPDGFGYALGYQMEGLLARMITDWIGDDGFVKMLDCRFRALPIFGDVYSHKGTVTGKRTEDGEHLVDLDVHTENQTGQLIVSGNATVRLLSRTI